MKRRTMKRTKHHRDRRIPISTMKELQTEKFRLQREILETEEGINNDYRNLVDALTFRNIINTIAEEVVSTNMIVSQAYSIIRPLFNRKKKKKKAQNQLDEIEPKVRGRRVIKKKQETHTENLLEEEVDKTKNKN